MRASTLLRATLLPANLLRATAPLLLVLLGGCGGKDMEIDIEGVERYGAFRYDEGAVTGGTGGGSSALGAVALPAEQPKPALGPPEEGAPGGAPAPAPAPKPRGKAAKYEVVAVPDGGTLKISCKLSKALDPFVFPLNKDKPAEGKPGCGHETMPSERAIVDPATLGLKNCVVWLTDITKGKDFEGEMAEKGREIVLDQKSCRYVPHVMLTRAGAMVAIKNSDPVQHNVKCFFNTRSSGKFNAMSSSGSLIPAVEDTTLEKPGNYILACDIHFWMTGYIRAVAHPYWAVTAEDGSATLTNVPPGTYKVGCWHEGMLMKVVNTGAEISGYEFSPDFEQPPQDVTIPASGSAEVTFTIDPR